MAELRNRIPEEVLGRLRTMAEANKVPATHVLTILINCAWARYEAGGPTAVFMESAPRRGPGRPASQAPKPEKPRQLTKPELKVLHAKRSAEQARRARYAILPDEIRPRVIYRPLSSEGAKEHWHFQPKDDGAAEWVSQETSGSYRHPWIRTPEAHDHSEWGLYFDGISRGEFLERFKWDNDAELKAAWNPDSLPPDFVFPSDRVLQAYGIASLADIPMLGWPTMTWTPIEIASKAAFGIPEAELPPMAYTRTGLMPISEIEGPVVTSAEFVRDYGAPEGWVG